VISRRLFLASAGSFVLARRVTAQPVKMWRIGVLGPGTLAEMAPYLEELRLGLRNLGYIEGQNIVFELRFDNGRAEALRSLAEELVALNVDIVVALTTPAALAAKRATDSLPIVMSAPSDPIGSGLIASLAHPGGNVTGQTDAAPDLTARRIQILKELVPRLKSVAALGHSSDPVWKSTWPEAQTAARQLRINIVPVLVETPDQLPAAFSGLNKRVQAVFVGPHAIFWVHRQKIIALAAQAKLPASYELRQFVDEGGLVSYGPDYFALRRSAARFVDKILKGASPADLPVEQPTHFELVFNRKTAKAIGLTIPQALLDRADEVIQ
jgi:putative ABC transport system substrate-binding protein